MDMRVRNRLTRLRQPVTQRLADPDPQTCAWIWVLPVPDGRVRVARVEVPRRLVESGECFGEDDHVTSVPCLVDVDEVDEAVRACGGDPMCLESPWRNEFPL